MRQFESAVNNPKGFFYAVLWHMFNNDGENKRQSEKEAKNTSLNIEANCMERENEREKKELGERKKKS